MLPLSSVATCSCQKKEIKKPQNTIVSKKAIVKMMEFMMDDFVLNKKYKSGIEIN